jgi:threonine/homoserine/homoserine lactone efflux protein
MNQPHLLVFAAAYLAVLVLPGPGVTALVARVMSRGTRGCPAFIAGFVAGSIVWFAIAATGLAALASTFAAVFLVVRYAGAAYLLYSPGSCGLRRPARSTRRNRHRMVEAGSSWPGWRSISATRR